jgi:hypothetical protein
MGRLPAGNTTGGSIPVLFDRFGMTTDSFCFYLQNRLLQTSQTGGQQYNDASPFSIPWSGHCTAMFAQKTG